MNVHTTTFDPSVSVIREKTETTGLAVDNDVNA
jgi:hypothetical protein